MLRGLQNSGLQEGLDFTVKRFNADGEISKLPLLMSAVNNPAAFDLLVTNTTPAMIAAAKSVKNIPVVFTVSSNPRLLGISKDGSLPPNMTGVYDNPPVSTLLEMALGDNPNIKSVGTISNPAEPNSQLAVARLRKACEGKSIRLHEIAISSVAEMPLCSQALCEKRPGAIIVCSDNTVTTSFGSLGAAAKKAGIPVYSTDPGVLVLGARAVYGADYFAWGEQSGRLAAKVLAGLPPSALPAEETSTMLKLSAEDAKKGVPLP